MQVYSEPTKLTLILPDADLKVNMKMNSLPDHADFNVDSSLWYLKKFNIFDNFSRDELESVTSILHLNEYKKREPIVLPSEPQQRIYFVIKGRAKLSRVQEDGKEAILEILGPGEVFGHIAFPKEHYFNALVVALEKCMVGHIHKKDFNALLAKKPDLCLEVNKVVGARLIKIENRLTELLFQDVPSRLARLLIRLSDEYPHEMACGLRIDMILTQQELANLIGASREMASITLNRFKQSGWIDIHSHHICVHDMQALTELAK